MEGIQKFGRRLAQELVSWHNPLNQIDTPTHEELAASECQTCILPSVAISLSDHCSYTTVEIKKTPAENLGSLYSEFKAADLQKRRLSQEIEVQKEESNVQIQNLIDEKRDAEDRAICNYQKFLNTSSRMQRAKEEYAFTTNRLQGTMEKMTDKELDLFGELYIAKRHLRELEDEITVIKHQQSLEQQEPECKPEYGQRLKNTRVEESFFVEKVQEEEWVEAEEEYVMASQAEFDRDFVMGLDEQDQQQAEIIQQLENRNHKLKSTLFEYQRIYPTLASLDNEKHRIERELLKAKRVRDENDQLKQENEQLKQQAFEWKLCLQKTNISRSCTAGQIISEFLHHREARDTSERQANDLVAEIKRKEASEGDLMSMVDDLRNEAVMLLKAKHSTELEKDALEHDKRMLQMHRDLLDHQVIVMSQIEEAKLGSDNTYTKYPMAKRIEELEGLIKNIQHEAEKARQEFVAAKLSLIKKQTQHLQENAVPGDQVLGERAILRPFDENGELFRLLSSDLKIMNLGYM
ncbi:hypothetical protein BX666DRAFT_2120366 [Dichotomocladium elegans]|nr:hypothetical protein BX666DRAFT_2120366 [Dichotomocladium elegans]